MTPSREKSNFTFILRHLCDCYYTCIAGLNTQFSKDLSTELRVDIIIFQTCFYKMNSSMISNSCRKKKKKKTNQLCMSIGFQIKNYGGVPSIFASAIHTEI